jgi:hypothetical protein
VGHSEGNCIEKQMRGVAAEMNGINPRGAWLRSNSFGRRIIQHTEKTFRSNIRNSLSGGQFSPIPKGLMEKMANLKVNTNSPSFTPTGQKTKSQSSQQQNDTTSELSI